MTNEDELRDYLELVAANLRRTRGYLREVEEKYQGPIAIVGMGVRGARQPAAVGAGLAGDGRWPFGDVFPALTTWRRGDRGELVTADWRYRLTWTSVADSGAGVLSGTWLVVAPAREQFHDMVAQCAGAMAGRGARVDTMLVDCRTISSDVLAGLLEGALAGEPLAGVVSFLGLNETPMPGRPAVPSGLAATRALTRALGDAGVRVPLWVLTREAVPLDLEHRDLEDQDRWSGLLDRSAEFGARAATLLCTVLTGWSAEADRERLQAVNEAARTPAQR
jgi:hypothetical protein